jgi:hypothetical protein
MLKKCTVAALCAYLLLAAAHAADLHTTATKAAMRELKNARLVQLKQAA